MSHFTVLVIGPRDDAELETALAPFDETAEVEPYLDEDYDAEAEYLRAREHALGQGSSEEEVADKIELLTNWDGGEFREGDDGLERWCTFNPRSRWDWWVVGGRWRGFLKVKDGARAELGDASWSSPELAPGQAVADRARKGDVDFDEMRREAGDAALEAWEKFEEIFERHGGQWPDMTWREHLSDETHAHRAQDLQREWFGSELVKDLRAGGVVGFMGDPYETFKDGREAFIQAAELASTSTYAVLHDGKWLEAGRMGWFGVGAQEQAQRDFNQEVCALVEGLDDDIVLTVVDCHV